MRKFLIFLTGFVCGALALLLISIAITNKSSNPAKLQGLTLFEQAGEVMPAKSHEVLQVITDGCALANAESGHGTYYGLVVLFVGGENTHYYDDQIINIPKGKYVRQIGTYQYPTQSGYKTVPAVAIYDK